MVRHNVKIYEAILALVALTACGRPPDTASSQSASPAGTTPSAATSQTQPLSSEDVARRAIHRRAVEAVIWGMPAVNYDLMREAFLEIKGADNQIVYWSKPLSWKNQTLTPNPDTIYLMPFINTKEAGPVVLEIPSADGGSITGSVDDAWQTAIEDVGPAGVDKGKGGKYLILPPDFKGHVPGGYIAMPSPTYQSYALLRSNLVSDSEADIAKAVAYSKRIKLYPFSQAATPPETTFIDAIDVLFDATIPYDDRFFRSLDRMVQVGPWLERDRAMIDILKSIGIEKGKTFGPDAKMQETLKQAAIEAHAWLDAKYETAFSTPYLPNTHWVFPALPEFVEGVQTNYGKLESYPLDDRGVTYSFGFFSAKHIGTGQFYLFSIKDKDGQALDGGSDYRLRVPPNAPVRLYWSATAYDRVTHTLIRDQQRSSRVSTASGLQKNADGSVDLSFAPTAPAGKESNWVPTRAGGQFEVLFRLYGPEPRFFEKAWALPDIEKTR